MSTGPEATEHAAEREAIYKLIPQRDALKRRQEATKAGLSVDENGQPIAPFTAEDEAELARIRAELARLISVWKKTGHAYKAQTYREISMQNSDYGGMENVNCTTIIASRMVPSDLLVDPGYLYMEGVKVGHNSPHV